jgi:hypothetical protein
MLRRPIDLIMAGGSPSVRVDRHNPRDASVVFVAVDPMADAAFRLAAMAWR